MFKKKEILTLLACFSVPGLLVGVVLAVLSTFIPKCTEILDKALPNSNMDKKSENIITFVVMVSFFAQVFLLSYLLSLTGFKPPSI